MEVFGIESLETMDTASQNLERMIRSPDVFKSLTLLDDKGGTIDVMVNVQWKIAIEKGRGTVEKIYVISGNFSRQMVSIKEISEYVMKYFYKGRFINQEYFVLLR